MQYKHACLDERLPVGLPSLGSPSTPSMTLKQAIKLFWRTPPRHTPQDSKEHHGGDERRSAGSHCVERRHASSSKAACCESTLRRDASSAPRSTQLLHRPFRGCHDEHQLTSMMAFIPSGATILLT